MTAMPEASERLWRRARLLALFTVFYNLAEGLVSVWFGVADEALTLFGFGADSFIEVLSGLGILAMVARIRRAPLAPRSPFERRALRVTGLAFFLLAVALGVSASYSALAGRRPQTTVPGLVVALLSIAVMWALVQAKRRVGRALACAPILADATCTLVCIWMSLVLLASSAVYLLTGFAYADGLGALGLIWFSVREGREALAKAAGMECNCAAGE